MGLSSQEPAQLLCSSKRQKQDKWRFWQERGGSAPLSTCTQPHGHHTCSRCVEGRPSERSQRLAQLSPITLTSKLRPSGLWRAAGLPTPRGHGTAGSEAPRGQVSSPCPRASGVTGGPKEASGKPRPYGGGRWWDASHSEEQVLSLRGFRRLHLEFLQNKGINSLVSQAVGSRNLVLTRKFRN